MARIPTLEAKVDEMMTTMRTMADRVMNGLVLLTEHLETPRRDELVKLIVWNHEVDRLAESINEACLQTFATLHPFGYDLRLVFATTKMSNIIRQIGDSVQSLARQLAARNVTLDTDLLIGMFRTTKGIVNRCYVAAFEGDLSLIQEIHELDDEVDEADRQIYFHARMVLGESRDPEVIEDALQLIHIASRLEKVADLACDWAKYIDFSVNGMARRQLRRFRDRVVFLDFDGGLSASIVASLFYRVAPNLMEISVVTQFDGELPSLLVYGDFLSSEGFVPEVFPVARLARVRWKKTLLVVSLGPQPIDTRERDFIPYKSPILVWDDVDFGFLRGSAPEGGWKNNEWTRTVLARAEERVRSLVEILARAEDV